MRDKNKKRQRPLMKIIPTHTMLGTQLLLLLALILLSGRLVLAREMNGNRVDVLMREQGSDTAIQSSDEARRQIGVEVWS